MRETDTASRYESLKYPIEIIEDEDAYVASVPDLPGCVAYGDTLPEALESLKSVKKLWIDGRLEAGLPIPEPTDLDEFSGKFVLRISRGLHKALQREARQQGVSLNQYVAHVLAERHQLVDLETVVQNAVRSCLTGSIAFAGAFDNWPLEPECTLATKTKHSDRQSIESFGLVFAALTGGKQSKSFDFDLESVALPKSNWIYHATKKAKPHTHGC